ncbi:ATP-binding protein [Haloarchaeobius sp. FL176]|uniref:sensor histidine kinase n=1 Tax=Haloarchaeobius sp. FL176 TaxID=2967129 RepID=UPI0021489C97|nr:ATP-binding protein [Haloarchaeobius sp. FL176]
MVDSQTQSVIESLPGAALVVDPDGRIRAGNESTPVVFGLGVREIVGATLSELVARDVLPRATRERFELLTADIGTDSEARTFRSEVRRGDGPLKQYMMRLSPYVVDGEFEGVLWSIRDVSTTQRYDETVDALQQATRELLAAETPESVYETCGRAANEVLGFPGVGVREYDPDEHVLRHVTFGATIEDVGNRPPYDIETSPHGRAFRRGETVVDEEISPEADPYEREAFTAAMYLPIGRYGILSIGKVAGTFDETDVRFAEILAENTAAAMRQVEQTLRLEEQRERLMRQNDRLDEFASVLAHDLRNPLNVGEGSFELYRETGDEDAAADVEYAFGRMRELIDEVLALARDGQQVDDMSPVELTNVARSAWANVDADDISLDVETDAVVEADDRRLKRLFENLLRNAVDHGSAADGVTADVTSVRVDDIDSGFCVADDGVGIPADERDTVFETGVTSSETGTGLGLAIVEQIVDAHGWTVTVTESEAGGARFAVGDVTVVED